MGCEDGVATAFGGSVPVEFGIAAAPGCAAAQFVAKVGADDPGLVFVTLDDGAPVGQPFFFRIIGVVPEAVAVIVLAAPVCAADVVVEDDHEVRFGQGGDDGIHDLHGMFAAELRVGFEGVVGDDGIFFDGFVSPGQAHGVYAKRVNLFDDDVERGVIEAAGDEFFLVEAVPVDGGEADGLIVGVEDLVAASVEGWSDLGLGSREGCASEEEEKADASLRSG